MVLALNSGAAQNSPKGKLIRGRNNKHLVDGHTSCTRTQNRSSLTRNSKAEESRTSHYSHKVLPSKYPSTDCHEQHSAKSVVSIFSPCGMPTNLTAIRLYQNCQIVR
jgi:hypothetical protein